MFSYLEGLKRGMKGGREERKEGQREGREGRREGDSTKFNCLLPTLIFATIRYWMIG